MIFVLHQILDPAGPSDQPALTRWRPVASWTGWAGDQARDRSWKGERGKKSGSEFKVSSVGRLVGRLGFSCLCHRKRIR